MSIKWQSQQNVESSGTFNLQPLFKWDVNISGDKLNDDDLKQIIKIDIPEISFNVVSEQLLGYVHHLPGKVDMGEELQITYNESNNLEITKKLWDWIKLVNADLQINSDDNFDNSSKQTITITIQDSEGNIQLQYKFINCFPKKIPDLSLDMTDVQMQFEQQQSFVYDYIEILDGDGNTIFPLES